MVYDIIYPTSQSSCSRRRGYVHGGCKGVFNVVVRGLSEHELDAIMRAPVRAHDDYASDARLVRFARGAKRLVERAVRSGERRAPQPDAAG